MGRCSLAIDNLLSVDVALADGKVVTASRKAHPDLFWAVRGGGNFGVATSFEYRLYPIGPMVTAGLVIHPFDRAVDLLRLHRDATAAATDELTLYAGLLHVPDGSGTKLAAIAACHCGPLDRGRTATRALKRFGTPVVDSIAAVVADQARQSRRGLGGACGFVGVRRAHDIASRGGRPPAFSAFCRPRSRRLS